ncbi:hypothetical protein BV881_21280 [Streptomyces sp. ZL-24]|nr:hypothetical protein BV881_21280 [Streptomyces sp. ZL-24]
MTERRSLRVMGLDRRRAACALWLMGTGTASRTWAFGRTSKNWRRKPPLQQCAEAEEAILRLQDTLARLSTA